MTAGRNEPNENLHVLPINRIKGNAIGAKQEGRSHRSVRKTPVRHGHMTANTCCPKLFPLTYRLKDLFTMVALWSSEEGRNTLEGIPLRNWREPNPDALQR